MFFGGSPVVIQPAGMWTAPKIQNLVSALGETGARSVFLGLALVNLVCAVVIVIKGRTAG